MKKVISKLDKKEYYIAVASNCENSDFIEGKRYQVRKATKDDCENSELYCIVNGTFWEMLPELSFLQAGGKQMINRYDGTYFLHKKVLKSECRKYLSYID